MKCSRRVLFDESIMRPANVILSFLVDTLKKRKMAQVKFSYVLFNLVYPKYHLSMYEQSAMRIVLFLCSP